MRNLKLTVEYDGTKFKGWQVQPNDHRTVQGEIEKVLNIILKKKVTIHGSGRTDTGVHALGQVAHFKSTTQLAPKVLLRALNSNLPEDVSITAVADVNERFHARISAKSKHYRYTVLRREARTAQNRNFCLWYPHKLNVTRMRQAAKYLIGRNDFRSFQAADHLRKEKKTVRKITELKISQKGDIITIDIKANGFLYKMARNIVGTLLEVGRGTLQPKDLEHILAAKDRQAACATAKAKGLCLVSVSY